MTTLITIDSKERFNRIIFLILDAVKTIDKWANGIHTGDAVSVLQDFPDDSVHSVMFSPPYWGQRDYDVEGQIGLEQSLEEYISNIATLTDELRRVLRPDGSMWINLGDGYGNQRQTKDESAASYDAELHGDYSNMVDNYNDKCKLLLPSRVAIELIDRGWILRNDVVWQKKNPMPESVTDRLSTTFEKVFHFVQEDAYYYDLDSVREPYETDLEEEPPIGGIKHQDNMNKTYSGRTPDRTGKGKNPGDVLTLATGSSGEGHFAVYPDELPELPIKATVPEKVCGNCATPYERTTPVEPPTDEEATTLTDSETESTKKNTVNWEKQCNCETNQTQSGIVLDPMCGRGTTCKAAAEHGRRYIGIELNPEYADIARDYVPNTIQRTLTGFDADS